MQLIYYNNTLISNYFKNPVINGLKSKWYGKQFLIRSDALDYITIDVCISYTLFMVYTFKLLPAHLSIFFFQHFYNQELYLCEVTIKLTERYSLQKATPHYLILIFTVSFHCLF